MKKLIIQKYNRDEALNCFVSNIKKHLGSRLKRIILFGSRARGDENPDSDYDFLIVLDRISNEIKDCIDTIAGEVFYEYSKPISAFAMSEERYINEKFNPFLMNIYREGINL